MLFHVAALLQSQSFCLCSSFLVGECPWWWPFCMSCQNTDFHMSGSFAQFGRIGVDRFCTSVLDLCCVRSMVFSRYLAGPCLHMQLRNGTCICVLDHSLLLMRSYHRLATLV